MLKSYVNMDKNNVLCANIVSPVPQNCNNVCDTQNSQDFEKKKMVFPIFKIRAFFVTFSFETGTLEYSKRQELKELVYE